MTVIAWDNTHIAWDGRLTAESSIYAHDAQKVKVVKGTIYGFCGEIGLWDETIRWHQGGARRDRVPNFGTEAEWQLLVITQKEIAVYSQDILSKIPLRCPFAIGSGSDFARGALLAGRTAYRSVKIACMCSPDCGGEIGTLAFADVFRGGLRNVKKVNSPPANAARQSHRKAGVAANAG